MTSPLLSLSNCVLTLPPKTLFSAVRTTEISDAEAGIVRSSRAEPPFCEQHLDSIYLMVIRQKAFPRFVAEPSKVVLERQKGDDLRDTPNITTGAKPLPGRSRNTRLTNEIALVRIASLSLG